jgi:HEAT repeat protein
LVNALNDNDSNVRKNAATALGKIKDYRAVLPLIQTLKYNEEYPSIREMAAMALANMANQ